MTRPDYVATADVFNVEIGVFWKRKRFSRWLRERGMQECDGAADGKAACVRDPEGVDWHVMLICDGAPEKTIVHECVHVADWIMDSAGVPCNAENTEIRAYLVAHIYQQVSKANCERNRA
ncbi:hypothetical protein [Citreimonas sp.]|uniref:hypothetical protein n=1 Tax=Citreimonas sp. TaxID=3036715 RepID=UPI004057D97A